MSVSQSFEEFWVQFKAALPPGASQFKADIEQHTKQLMLRHFRQMDLVTREEFDVQRAVLQKAIIRLKALESQLKEGR